MTKISGSNSILQGLQGKFGKTHSYRMHRGKMVMSSLPDVRKPRSPKQEARDKRFQRAIAYAKKQMEDRNAVKLYETGVTANKATPYVVAVTDSLKAPSVDEIRTLDYLGNVGDAINIIATDDFQVVRVRVIIKDGNGNRIEQGDALQDEKNNDTWRYKAAAANPSLPNTKISVTAYDRPDNETTSEVVL